jgi:hypothetical protein
MLGSQDVVAHYEEQGSTVKGMLQFDGEPRGEISLL